MKKKKIVMISSMVLSLIMLFNGCTLNDNNNTTSNDITFKYSDEDLNNFVTDEELNIYHWYVIETFDGNDYDIKITRKTTSGKMDKKVNEYYYTDALKEDYKVYAVLYNHEEKLFWVESGPDIISAVPLTDYLDKFGLRKASYSKDEFEKTLEMIKEEYKNKKELTGKKKVLVKDNSMY